MPAWKASTTRATATAMAEAVAAIVPFSVAASTLSWAEIELRDRCAICRVRVRTAAHIFLRVAIKIIRWALGSGSMEY